MNKQHERLAEALADRYRIERELGAGGMATVFLAQDLKHDRKVALKVLRPELSTALGGDRFPREIHIVAQLSHPHILPLHDSGEVGGMLYYVMPYVDGETLRQRMKREGALPLAEAARILREVVDALAYAHQHGVVHRDIKPENVMLSGRHAIVMDFGVAKALSAAGGEKLTTVGVALGTPTYMAPEQAMGETDIDHRADIYAVGALAYEMLAGAPPFDKPTAQATLSAHVMEQPVDLAERRPGVLPQLSTLVMRCLQKDRAERWQSADDLLPALEALSTPSGGITPTDTRPIRAAPRLRPARRKRWIPAVAAAGIAIAALGAWLLFGGGGGGTGRIEQIAVLPIQDLSGTDKVFVDTMHDALISALARTDVAGVVSRSAVLRYGDGSTPTRQIAQELNADAILEGTVFRDGDRVRINVQLVEPQSLRHLWAQTYERSVTDVFEAQRDIVERIAAEIKAALGGEPAVSAGDGGTALVPSTLILALTSQEKTTP